MEDLTLSVKAVKKRHFGDFRSPFTVEGEAAEASKTPPSCTHSSHCRVSIIKVTCLTICPFSSGREILKMSRSRSRSPMQANRSRSRSGSRRRSFSRGRSRSPPQGVNVRATLCHSTCFIHRSWKVDMRKAYIGNIPFDTTPSDIRREFGEYGEIV